ncbi:juvenile hormone epoxide hydrolase isoform X2 [Manduca sexta]|nr:juvenile hormone epoxide hydrolase isoform X2 [Manduca sexta]
MIRDLRHRIWSQRRVVPPLNGVGFEYGFNSNQLYPWLKYWAEEYPFKEREDFINQYPQYKTNIQGLHIHFIHVKPVVHPGKEVVPLLILHGWPGSVREFYETIPHLTAVSKHRDFAVEIIAPSLPGFGFSDSAVRPGLGATEMGVVFRNLMRRLGHQKFYIQGGDWGSYIGQSMATLFPKEVLGYHTNLAVALTPKAFALTLMGAAFPPAVVDPLLADRMYPLLHHILWLITETGYMHLQSTKPDSLGVAMTDSPGGLMAYFLQMFSSGTRRKNVFKEDGGLHSYYPRAHLIDNLMMYWVPNSITTSFRIYAETINLRNLAMRVHEIPTPVPTCTIHAKDEILYQSPPILQTKFPNLLNSTVLFDGGHFLALEMPELFADNVLNAIATFRNWHYNKIMFLK